jgi:hypothetical protein
MDGRYQSIAGELAVLLRLDVKGAGVISADVSRGEDYLASVRTAPGIRVTALETGWAAVWRDSLGTSTTGTLSLAAVPDHADSLAVTLRADGPLNGLPAGVDLPVVVDRAGDELRELGLEIETEEGVAQPGPVTFQHAPIGIRESFRRAGFAVHDAGVPSTIPRRPEGWDYSTIFTALHDGMTAAARAGLTGPSWDLHLLLLSTCSRAGLMGIMFDPVGLLPRQGCAAFLDAIRQHADDGLPERHVVRTAVHELGHGLNLAHRFESQVGHVDSTSFMNYDWRYLGGDHVAEYWDRFAYAFDPDELEFLHHAPRPAIRPGDAIFHSVDYWSTGTGGFTPFTPTAPGSELLLSLVAPPSGPVFALGQPVFLEAVLENLGDTAVSFAANPLDPKTGYLEIRYQAFTGRATAELADARTFVPMMVGCLLPNPDLTVTLGPHDALRNNVNLAFGAGGVTFTEPGTYDIVPILNLPSPDGPIMVRGDALRIRIAQPQDPADERDVLVLQRADVGAWFALGGSDALARAGDDLAELSKRRQAVRGAADPIVTAIVRAAGINAGRRFTRIEDGQIRERPSDPARAAALLGSLGADALATLDADTAAGTIALARDFASRSARP